MEYKEAFCIVIYIIIFVRIVIESLSICVLNGSFFAFYIYTYLNSQIILNHCRSPPINTNFKNSYDWRFFCGRF